MHARVWKTDHGWRLEPSSATELALFRNEDAVTGTSWEARVAELYALAAETSGAVSGPHEAVNKLLGVPTAPTPSLKMS